MIPVDQIPDSPAEEHFLIPERAAENLGRIVDGNGLKPEQVRVAKHDTIVHMIPAYISFELKPKIAKNLLPGEQPRGETLASASHVQGKIADVTKAFVSDVSIHKLVLEEADKLPEKGFGMDPFEFPLQMTRKEFSVIEKCTSCQGAAQLPCQECGMEGSVPCVQCNGAGRKPCPQCYGQGRIQSPDGSQQQCNKCYGQMQVPCFGCQGQRRITCPRCAGQRHIPCQECGHNGHMTTHFSVLWHAAGHFKLEKRDVPSEPLNAIEKIGIKQIETERHAEVFRLTVDLSAGRIDFPMVAFFPMAQAEFSVEGRMLPAVIAGLHGHIMEIEPFLDKIIKPGVTALFKISRGGLAAEALMNTACKFRILRETLGALAHHPKKAVYKNIMLNYPMVISDKYARACVRYADMALLSLSYGPRLQGLAIGTLLSAIISAFYFSIAARSAAMEILQTSGLGRHILLIDIAIWLVGYALALFCVRLMAARGLKRILPETLRNKKDRGLPVAGPQGLWALGTTLGAWLAAAALAAQKPAWMLSLLQHAGF